MKMTPRVIVIGGLTVVLSVVAVVVFLPYLIFKPEDSLNARPYTKLEAEGRALYIANGCSYCHSQFTRPQDVTPDRASEAGDFNYDRPHQLGTLRTGPDLADIGLKRGDKWEIDHLIDPRKFTPNSIMPSFSFLSQHQLEALVAYLNRLGNQRSAQADVMVPDEMVNWKNPLPVSDKNWYKGKEIFINNCITCHGCAGNGMGPYSHKLNQRPADLRQAKYGNYPEGFVMWRISEGVPGTAMPQWKNSLSKKDRELVALYVRHSFMRPEPHYQDEGDLPKSYQLKDPLGITPNNTKPSTLELIDNGKRLYTTNCTPCHGYSGAGRGPDSESDPKLVPEPPDLRDRAHFSTFTDGDWYWRISEGILFRSMPQWKFLLSERERWELVNYVRDILALPAKGREPDESDTPKKYNNLKFPKGTSYERGREVYMMRCALCHGYGGQGEGLDGDNLDPAPANFTDPDVRNMGTMGHDAPAMDKQNMPAMKGNNMAMTGGSDMTMTGEHDTPATGGNDTPTKDKQMDGRGASSMGHDMSAMGDGHWFWRVTEGVRNTAMPIWGLLLSEQERWDVIKYVQDTYTFPKPPARINYAVPQEFQEITNPITESGDEAALKNSIANGAELYQTHCAGCHGTKGEGFGKFAIELNPKAGPLAKNPRIAKGGDDFIFYIVSQGINHTPMAPFEYVLSESEIWDLVNYIKTLSPASLAEN